MPFTLTISNHHHAKLADVLAQLPQVSFNPDKRSGTLTDPETGGKVAFHTTGPNVIHFEVLDGNGKDEKEIKKQISEHVEQLVKSFAG